LHPAILDTILHSHSAIQHGIPKTELELIFHIGRAKLLFPLPEAENVESRGFLGFSGISVIYRREKFKDVKTRDEDRKLFKMVSINRRETNGRSYVSGQRSEPMVR
jgi:hypothetical protein